MASSAALAQATFDPVLRLFHEAWSDVAASEFRDVLARRAAEPDAGMYLLLRTFLAEERWDQALEAADGFLAVHTRSGYLLRVRFGKAQALYGAGNLTAASEELNWVVRNSRDSRLKERCRGIQSALKKQSSVTGQHPESMTEEPRAAATSSSSLRVALVTVFPDANDPAASSLRNAFAFAANFADYNLAFHAFNATASLEAYDLCERLMADDSLLVVVFAGDEGSAIALAHLSERYRCPLLKLTSDARSMTALSSQLIEFLPSAQTQAGVMGEFAAQNLSVHHAMILAPEDVYGRCMAAGFERGLNSEDASMDTIAWYPADATSIRRELSLLFGNRLRIRRGETPLTEALSADERAEAFGDVERGEVLVSSPADTQRVERAGTREALFAILTRDRLDDFAGQLRAKPARTVLLGNSAWYNEDILARHREITDGMHFVTPLLPQVAEQVEPLASFLSATQTESNEWVLLGLDAGAYVAYVLRQHPQSRAAVLKALTDSQHFTATAVSFDFAGTRENRGARILQFDQGELRVVK